MLEDYNRNSNEFIVYNNNKLIDLNIFVDYSSHWEMATKQNFIQAKYIQNHAMSKIRNFLKPEKLYFSVKCEYF